MPAIYTHLGLDILSLLLIGGVCYLVAHLSMPDATRTQIHWFLDIMNCFIAW